MNQPDRRKYILRATFVYMILASAWILLSDLLLTSFAEISAIQWLSAVKGIFFVIVTAFLLFIALRGVPDEPLSAPDIPSSLRKPVSRWSKVWPYLFALAATMGMLLVRSGLAVSYKDHPLLILIIFPVILSAMAGGCGPGLTATLIAALGGDYLAIPPLHSFKIGTPADLFQWSFLIANGVLVSVLSEFLHRLRRQTEATRRLQAVTLASINDGVIATDTGGRITYLNPEAERLTGWSAGAALGRPLAEVFRIISEENRQPLADRVVQILISGEKTDSANQALLLSREGQELPIQESGAPIRLADGTLLGIALIFRDDTQRRQAETAVQEERSLYQDLVNAQPAGIYRIRVNAGKHWAHETLNTRDDLPYVLEIASDRFCEIMGASCRNLHDDPGLISRRIHPDDVADFIQANEKANAELQPFNWEGRFLNAGRVQWLQFQSLPRRLDNGDVIWTGILSDISARKQAEMALRESQEQFTLLATLLEQSSQPFAQGFPDGRLGFHNQAYLDLIGYSEEELTSLDWARDLTPPEWLDQEREILAQLHETGQPVRYEKEYIRKDGLRVPVELLVHLARDEEDQPLYYYSFVTDLNTRIKAQKDLRKSEQTYRSLVEHMLNGLAYCRMLFIDDNPEDFVYLTVNDAFSKLTGLRNVEGRRVSEVIPGIRQLDPKLFERYGRVARGGPPERFEIYVTALQMWFWISVYSPKPDHFVAVFDVITERKEAELALRENAAQLRAISDNLPDTYLYQTTQGTNGRSRFLFISGGVTRVHGVTPEEVLRDPRVLYGQVDPAQLKDLIQAEKNSIETQKDFVIELHMQRPDGEWRWLLVRSRPRRKPDGSMVWDGAATDITSRKSLENQLLQAQKIESVGRLAGGVAHDFNNILTVISGHTELALEQLQPGEPLFQDLLEIKSAAARSANLTRQLLAFARKQTVSPVVLDMNDTLVGMLKMLQRLIGEDIELAWMPGHDLWPVKIDPSQVDQLLANLAVNARDAIAGVGQLTIETSNTELDREYCAKHLGFVPGQYVQLEVSDNGCGMNPAILAYIFEPFFTTKEEGQGTGLGLATVYGIVKQNQGFINVYSEPDHGTTFRIYLPRVKEETAESTPAASRDELPRGNETILIVEDDMAILDLGRRFIERLGYTVLTAASPSLALKVVEDYGGTIDLLITDVVMPEMNGKELAGLLQEMKPGLKCLFMSGYTADAIARQGILDQGICFLSKPFSSRDIALKVREALARPASTR